jgi:hypothetical protein
MQIELATIPPYLTAYFSIIDPVNPNIDEYPNPPINLQNISEMKKTLRQISGQEMLHLVMVGNIMKSLGFQPKLYNIDFVVEYPAPIPFFDGGLIFHLLPASKTTLESFIQIEKPEPVPNLLGGTSWIYLGKFYKDLENTMEQLSQQGVIQFRDNTAEQFPEIGYRQETGPLVQVKNLQDAKRAIQIIITQGEGSTGESEFSHYYRFQQALNTLEEDPLEFSKHVQNFDGDATKPIFTKLITQSTLNDFIVLLSTFNAAYCYILLIIENIYMTDNPIIKNTMVAGMFIIMKQILPNLHNIISSLDVPQQMNSVKAAPLYYFYNFENVPDCLITLVKSTDSPKKQLVSLIQYVDNNYSSKLNIRSMSQYANHLPEVVIHPQ